MSNVLFRQLYANQNRMIDRLDRMTDRMAQTLDRIETQLSALVENAYRLPCGCEFAEVQSVAGAVPWRVSTVSTAGLRHQLDRSNLPELLGSRNLALNCC